MENQLREMLNAAERAADEVAGGAGIAEVKRCVEALVSLRRSLVTSKVLADTMAIEQLRPLTEHRDQKIQSAATALLQTWEIKAKSSGGKNPDLSSLIRGDEIRDRIRINIAEALSKVEDEAKLDVRNLNLLDIADKVETELFKNLGESNTKNNRIYRSKLFNISDENNQDFRRKVLLGEIKPEDLTEMSSEDMASDARKRSNEQAKAAKKIPAIDRSKCDICGKKDVTSTIIDCHPKTTSFVCPRCGNDWKVVG